LPYKSIFTKSFTKEFDKLPKNMKERVVEALKKSSESPYLGTRLQGKFEGLWRWRVGKYRIVYFIDETGTAVVFVDVGLRKSIYE